MKTALVTGCTEGGIGHGLAIALLDRGWNVYGTVRSLGKEGDLASRGAKMLQMDVTDTKSMEAAKAAFLLSSKQLHLLINNAGSGSKEALLEVSEEEVLRMFQTNVFGLLRCCQIFAPLLLQAGSGTIVNVGSVAGLASVPWMGLYGASKAAVRSLTTTLSYELGPLGVKVVHLAPALIDTPFSQKHERLNYTGRIYTKDSIEASEEATDNMVRTDNGRGMHVTHFARQVIALVDNRSPPAEIILGTVRTQDLDLSVEY